MKGSTATLGTLAELVRRDQLDEAEAGYRAALETNGALPEAHAGLTTVLRRQGRRREASVAVQNAITAIGSDLSHGEPVSLQEKAARFAKIVSLGCPADKFERFGRRQFVLLIRNGLYPTSKVLELGCGALNAAYFTIHFLEPDHYFGIEPRSIALTVGREHLLEPELVAAKRPRFDSNASFDLAVFDEPFDFVIANSIWPRATKDQIRTMLDGFAAHATERGVFLASYWQPNVRFRRSRDTPPTAPEPSFDWIQAECLDRDLVAWELPDETMRYQVWLRIQRQG